MIIITDALKVTILGYGSEWTKLHPFIRAIDIIPYEDFKEDMITLQYIKKYGLDNVRGGKYSQIDLSDEHKREIQQSIWHNDGLCFKCGSNEHYIKDCDQ